MQKLTGKRVLITGASSGIGAATARLLADAGASVFATGRTIDALHALAQAAPAGAIEVLAGDLSAPSFIESLAAAAGPVDILINNAGALKHTAFLEGDPADWARVLDTNIMSLLRLTQLVARGMVDRRRGHIVNVSSLLARRVAAFTMVYAASKHAVAAISEGLRLELRRFGIRVTEIAPGIVETNVFRSIDDPAIRARYTQQSFKPLTAVQIAEAILYAVSSEENACPQLIELKPSGQE